MCVCVCVCVCVCDGILSRYTRQVYCILVLSNDSSLLIASKIFFFFYIIYVSVLCIFIMYKYTCMYIFQKKIFVYIKCILEYNLYEYKYR